VTGNIFKNRVPEKRTKGIKKGVIILKGPLSSIIERGIKTHNTFEH